MSKPNPRLSKGIVRTLAQSHHSHAAGFQSSSTSHSHVITLAPVINQYSSSSSSSTSSASSSGGAPGSRSSPGVVYGPHLPPGHTAATAAAAYTSSPAPISASAAPTTPWSLPLPSHLSLSALGSSSYSSLLPSWETILPPSSSQIDSIVLPYRPSSSNLRTSLQSRPIHTQAHHRRYSSAATAPSSSFLTPSLPPSFFTFDKPSLPNSAQTPSTSSLDELIAALELNSLVFDKPFSRGDSPTSSVEPPFQTPPSPGPSSSPGPGSQHPVKPPRPAETHTVLSPTPLPPNDTPSNGPAPIATYPSLSPLSAPLSDLATPDPTVGNAPTTSAYSSSLIFHLGASGLPKDRIPLPPSSSAGKSRPPAPPRQRSFPLPDVKAPSQFNSISVGEDAYFARLDGLCIADGVGGWARSGAGGADPGRWSRLLTHFCEVEVGDWWAGAEFYLPQPNATDESKKAMPTTSTSASAGKSSATTLEERREAEEAQQWAKDAWASGAGADGTASKGVAAAAANETSTANEAGAEGGRTRRPLDPVEIMQRGYEKCLACVTAEGILGSSTCLLALLHNSTLHIANLGDCCLLVIRDNDVVFRTSEMQHAFNFPLQVGTHSRDEPMKDAMRFDVPVKKGDIVVLGSDGLMDNLFDEDILDVVAQFTTPSTNPMPNLPPTPPNSRPTSSSSSSSSSSPNQTHSAAAFSKSFSSISASAKLASATVNGHVNGNGKGQGQGQGSDSLPFPPFSPQRVSDALCRRARAVSELVTATTPFMCKAIEEGIDFVGGKKDDISVLVGVVGDRPQPRTDGTDVRGPGALALHT